MDQQDAEAKAGTASARDLEKAYDRLADAGKQLLKIDALTKTYQTQTQALADLSKKTADARVKLKEMTDEFASAETKTKKQETALARQARTVEKLSAAETKRADTVKRITAELDRYGVSTDNIAAVQASVVSDVNRVNASLAKQEAALESLAANQAIARASAQRKAEAEAEERAGQRVIDSLQRQAAEAIATARGYRTLGRVTVQTVGQINSIGDSLQKIYTPSEAARRTLAGLEAQVDELGQTINKRGRDVKDLKGDLRELDAAQRRAIGLANLVDQLRNQVAALRVARTEYNAAKAQVAELAAQLRVAGADVGLLGQKLQTAQQRLQNASRDMNTLAQSARQTRSALRDAGVETNKLNEAEAKLVATSMRVVQAANQASTAIRQQGNTAKTTTTFMERLADSGRESLSMYQRIRGEVIALATTYAGLQGAINLAGGSVDAYKLREQSLIKISTAVGQSQQALAAEWEYMLGLADKLGIRIDVLAPSYTKFAVAAKAAGMTMQETKFIFESFAKSAAVLQLSQADMEGTFRAIEQVISKGQVYAEELRGQLGERLPGAVSLFAEATGRSIAELNKALEAGEVSAREIINFASANAKRIDAQLASADKSVSAAENRLANAQTMFKLAIADAGFINAYADAINKITSFLKSEDGKNLANGIAEGFIAVAEAIGWAAENIDTIKSILVTLIGLKVGAWLIGIGAMAFSSGKKLMALGAQLGTIIGNMTAATSAAGKMTGALAFLRVGMSALLRLIPFVGAALLAWDLGNLIYQTEKGKAVIDGLMNTLKKLPSTLKAVLLTIPALLTDIGSGLMKGIVDTVGRDSILAFHEMVADFVEEIPVVGEMMAKAIRALSANFDKNTQQYFGSVKGVWEDAQKDWDAINQQMVKTDQQKYDEMLKQAKTFANKIQAVTKTPMPLADEMGFKGVPLRRPGQADDFIFTKDPGTGVTERDRQINSLTKKFEKLEEAAKKANKASKEMEQRKNLPGRLALVDEEFSPIMAEAKAIGGSEGAKLVARLKEIIALRKQAEVREFQAQNAGGQNARLESIRKLSEEYDRLFANVGQKAAKIDPTLSFDQRMQAALDKMAVQYDQLVAKAQRLGGVEGDALAEKFENLRKINAEYVKEQQNLDELNRLQTETTASINTKKALIEQINSLREAGVISESEQVARVIETNNAMNAGIAANLVALQEFAVSMQSMMTPEMFARINAEIAAMQAGLKDVTGTYTEMDTAIVQGVLGAMQTSLNSITESLVEVINGTASWGDVFKNLGVSVAKFFADLLMQLAQAILTQMILNAISGAGWGGISSAATSMGGVAAKKHNGGIVGDKTGGSGSRSAAVNPAWFANAPRFHTGGFPGLKADEVPIIAQKGEQILSKDDPDNVLNRKGEGPASAGGTGVRFVLVDDRAKIPEAMNSSEGDRVIVQALQRNLATVKQMVNN